MKSNKRLFHRLHIVLIFTLLWGCLEYDITTQVMPNGSMLRTVIVKGDSTDIFTGSFRVPDDSSWTIITRRESRNIKDINEDKIFVYEARKEFENFNDLNRTFYSDTSFNDHINIEVNLNTKVRWFYKFYVYSETYSMLFPFRSEPLKKYLSKIEHKIYLADEKDIYYSPEQDKILFAEDSLLQPLLTQTDSLRFKAMLDSIDHKYERWLKVNIYNDFYELVTGSLNKLGMRIDTAAARTPFFNWLDTTNTVETGFENSNAFVEAAAVYFKIDPQKLQAADPGGFDKFSREFKVAAFSPETYTNRVLMPGMIVRTNAGKIDVNMATWTFKSDNFYAADYEMTVESRIINKWFVVGAATLLVALIGLLLVPIFKK